MPKTSFSGLKWYSPPPAFLDLLNLRFFSFVSWEVTGFCELEIDAEESVAVESVESTRCAWSRFPGKNFASPPTDLGEAVGVFSASNVGVTGVKPPTGARRSSSSSSSSSEERASWKTGAPAFERTVPMPSV